MLVLQTTKLVNTIKPSSSLPEKRALLVAVVDQYHNFSIQILQIPFTSHLLCVFRSVVQWFHCRHWGDAIFNWSRNWKELVDRLITFGCARFLEWAGPPSHHIILCRIRQGFVFIILILIMFLFTVRRCSDHSHVRVWLRCFHSIPGLLLLRSVRETPIIETAEHQAGEFLWGCKPHQAC